MTVQNVLTDITNNTQKVYAEQNATKKGNSSLDQDAFLQLLMMEMKNQDPLNPTSNKEFIAQQAQFTQVSELQKLNKSLGVSNQLMQASSLIGKQVTLQDPNSPDKTIEGMVSEARIDSKGANVLINDKEYPISLVKGIKNSQTST